MRPFRDFLSRQLKRTSSQIHHNPYLFSIHQTEATCFSVDKYRQSLRLSAAGTSIKMNTSLYRQVAVSIAKKYLPQLVQPFDPHNPVNRNGILRMLAFQTGHLPKTHAHHYAMEREFPSQLQPDLINRYLYNSSL